MLTVFSGSEINMSVTPSQAPGLGEGVSALSSCGDGVSGRPESESQNHTKLSNKKEIKLSSSCLSEPETISVCYIRSYKSNGLLSQLSSDMWI